MMQHALAFVSSRFSARFERFRGDERGAMAVFIIFIFVIMLMFGGIAVDVMRFETRRVALQQTMDRAALAAANLNNSQSSTTVVNDYFAKAQLGDGLNMVQFATPTVTPSGDGTTFKRVSISSSVRSYNFFMNLMDIDYLESPASTAAEQGVSTIEVFLVLDVSGSMRHPITSGGVSKIEQLRLSATNFVNTVKSRDVKNEVSIGIVPYNAQVNVPVALRNRFNVANLATFGGVANAGYPNANCLEVPTSTYGTMALSTTATIRMAAVADTESGTATPANGGMVPVADGAPTNDPLNRICNPTTANQVFLPTKSAADVNAAIANLTHGGFTSISIGMRWGTALIDQSARPIYTAIANSSVAGRPANNETATTRKIIVLMTDGENDDTFHINDTYKTGVSPIWRGQDGNFAIRFTTGGQALTGNTRPSCASNRTYFVPHLKPSTSSACNSAAWLSSLTGTPWTGSGTVRQLDWSEVWHHLRLSYVARQLYGRSNVSGVDYSTVRNTFRQEYIDDAVLNSTLQTNCNAARAAGVEIYGIAFAAPTNGQTQIRTCASSPESNYYFNATSNAALEAAFNQIAAQISELRLTQ